MIRIAVLALFGSAVLAVAGFRTPEPLTWHTDLDKARALAREQGKPLLLVFR